MTTERIQRARRLASKQGIDVLLLSVGADLPYLTGYEAMPLERLTMLVLPVHGDATLVVPALEAPRVIEQPDLFSIRPWRETEDPVSIVADLAGRPETAAIGDRTWSTFLLALQRAMPSTTFTKASSVMSRVRATKTDAEVELLRRAAAAVDLIAADLQTGSIPLVGRTEAEVSADLGRRMLESGHDRVNFAIVAAGENAASPHHHAGGRVIERGEVLLCDFGGTMIEDGVWACSDITRCAWLGEPPAEFAELYDVLFEAQAAGVATAEVGTPAEDVDRACRKRIADAGYGDYFVHRTGHGIGFEAHEDPYIVEGNASPLVAGNAFSVEPGIYIPGKWGARLEDIVVATESGPEALNKVDHHLAVIDV